MIGYGNSMFLATHGILARTASGGGVDPDAQAFITAAAITDPTQQSAINTLVVDLKGYGVWTKMKGIWPFVGGTASAHKWNLKDPRDLDAAFRLTFFGGLTHNSNGVIGNGSNGYFNTHILLGADVLRDDNASGVYVRTNVGEDKLDYGCFPSDGFGYQLGTRFANNTIFTRNSTNVTNSVANTDSRGFFQMTRRNSSGYVVAKNSTKTSNSVSSVNVALTQIKIFGLAMNATAFGGASFYSSKEIAFHYYANSSLSDTELDNLYTAVQAFQTTLGRSIGTQTVSDADAQAFVTNAGIVDQVEANAVNNLVIGLKADGLWTKMKALYPMVGGSSSTMKYNLKNPLDTDAAFRLVFSGGWTFSSNGALPNGTNGYANTYCNPQSNLGLQSNHLSFYSRTQVSNTNSHDIGAETGIGGGPGGTTINFNLFQYFNAVSNKGFNDGVYPTNATLINNNNTLGFQIGSRTSINSLKLYFNNSLLNTNTISKVSSSYPNYNIYIGATNSANTAAAYSSKQCAFASIGDGLTDTEATNFYNRVQTFNTALARQV